MSLALLISKYSWALILVGIIAWFSYMALKKPNKENPENLSRLGLAIEKAKPIFENFQKNVAESYAPKPEPKKEVKETPGKGITDIKQEDIIKPIDF